MDLPPQRRPPPADIRAETALLRIAQSVPANSVRHTEAGTADVTLSYLDDHAAVDVIDDGNGFGLAILPPELRFNSTQLGVHHRIFAARESINGVNGYAIAPSAFRPELSVWSHSEGGLFRNGEYGAACRAAG